MSSGNTLSQLNQTDDSDDLDLLTLSNCITQSSRRTANESHSLRTSQENSDEPDWVQQFSQSLPNEQQRRQALTSQFDEDDDDSIIDLVPDDPDPTPTQPSMPSDGLQSQKDGEDKTPLKRQKTSAVPRSQMPLVVAPKLDDSLVLLQSADQNLDLSGDLGAVGRVKVRNGLLHLDIKGTVYRAITTSCNTACVVSVGEDEAKVTSILDETLTLVSEQDLFASSEILVQGELSAEEEDAESRKKAQPDGESKSKRRRPPERSERENEKSAAKAKSSLKSQRKKS